MKTRYGHAGIYAFDRRTGLNLLIDEVSVAEAMWSKAPRYMSVALTNACELACSYCYAPKLPARLDAAVLSQWAQELDAAGCFGIGFGGGEPTLFPNFVDLCRTIHAETELALTMTTHGHRFNSALVEGLAGNIDFIRVSMDGVGSTYERLRGKSFEVFKEKISLVKEVAPFGVNFVVNRDTIYELSVAAEFVFEQCAREFLLLPEMSHDGTPNLQPDEMDYLSTWVRDIVLECKPLGELSWDDIDGQGPILAMVTPTTLKEIDSKKQDGRLGKRAREFNRLIAQNAAGSPPVTIRRDSPRVEIAIARINRIPWEQYDDLDPSDGDSCIVAEILHSKNNDHPRCLFLSHDIEPIAFATSHDLETVHVSDDWLRQVEPGPVERENQRLKAQIAVLQSTQPKFEINVDVCDRQPLNLVRIKDLTPEERGAVTNVILGLYPRNGQSQGSFGIGAGIGTYDYSYDRLYDQYLKNVPLYVAQYAARIERMFNQVSAILSVTNSGPVQAENLLVEATISGGWLHNKYIFASPRGPIAPTPDPLRHVRDFETLRSILPPPVGRHEMVYKDKPNCSNTFSVTCEDFRQGERWQFDPVLGIDVRQSAGVKFSLSVTASNFRGTERKDIEILTSVREVAISDVVDLKSLKIVMDLPTEMEEALKGDNYTDIIDFEAFK